MKPPLRVTLLAVCLLALSGVRAPAQNPFGGGNQAANQGKKAGAGGQGNPFGGAGAAGGAAGQAGAAGGQLGKKAAPNKKAPPQEKDLIVLAIRRSNPTTPSQLVKAIDSMRKLDRPQFAKEYLKKLTALNLDDNGLIELHEEFGSGHFKELSDDENLKPENGLLYKNLLESAANNARDEARIDGVVQQLNSNDRSRQLSALTDLRRVGTRAVPRMLLVLADANRASEHRNIRLALVGLGNLTVEPMIGALESQDTKFAVQVMHVLARLKATRALPFLLGPMFVSDDPLLRHMARDSVKRIVGEVPERGHAELYLQRRIKAHLGGETPIAAVEDRYVRLWHWDDQAKTVKHHDYSIAGAAKLSASQAASQLLALDPDNKEYRTTYLIATLAAQKTLSGIDRRVAPFEPEMEELKKKFKVSEVERALAQALKRNEIEAAVGAAEALGELGSSQLVESTAGTQRVLVEASQHRDPWVRFAATETILGLDPSHGFPGSSGIVASLARIIGHGGQRRVVVAHPSAQRKGQLQGEAGALGFEVESARTGRKLFQLATKNHDVELIIMSEKLAFPRTIEVYQSLRHSPQTAGVPIAILSSPDDLLKNQEIYREDPLTLVTVEPYGDGAMAGLVRKLQKLPKHGALTPETRKAWSQRALMWVGRLAENPKKYRFYNLQRLESSAIHAMQVPETSAVAANFLGLLGTPAAQQALVDFVSRHNTAIELRQAAAEAFGKAVKRHRVLLTRAAIQRQYDRYNNTAKLDRETQMVMGSVLNSIELPTKEKNAKDP